MNAKLRSVRGISAAASARNNACAAEFVWNGERSVAKRRQHNGEAEIRMRTQKKRWRTTPD
jgi:hypothetical protein